MILLTHDEALKNGVSVQMQLEPLPLIEEDRVQLQQVVLNLILNAVEAMSTVEDVSGCSALLNSRAARTTLDRLHLNAHSYRPLDLIGRGGVLLAIARLPRLSRLMSLETGRYENRFCAHC